MSKVSVILPVYNGEAYLKESVESILGQTFRDFTLYAIDDGSTDNSLDILSKFNDSRLKIVCNDGNKGLIYTLNKGIGLSNESDFIARMDADDISLPTRFEEELLILKKNPEVGLVGSSITYFGSGQKEKTVIFPETIDKIIPAFLIKNPIVHPSVIIRRSALGNLKYDSQFLKYEDYKLWLDLLGTCKFYNIPKVLLRYRRHQSNVTNQAHYNMDDDIVMIKKILSHYAIKLNLNFSTDQILVLSVITSTYRWKSNTSLSLELLYETVSSIIDAHSRKSVDTNYLTHLLFEKVFVYLVKCKRISDALRLVSILRGKVNYLWIAQIHSKWF